MKRVALSIITAGCILLAGVVPAFAGGGPDVPPEVLRLAGTQLSETELAGITGRGSVHEAGSAEAARVIIWDEGPAGGVVSRNSSTGHGATQSSTVTINGR